MPLSSSQHFPAWRASQMSVQVRLWDLASARHVWLSVKMSVAVSRSVSQSYSFEESYPLNVGISWSKDVVRVASLCVVHKVSRYACIVVCMGSSLGWGVGCGWSVIVRCCSLSVSCVNSAICVGGWVAGSNWRSQSWSCWNWSFNSAKWWGVSSSSLYSSDDSSSYPGIVWSGGTRSRGAVSWGAGTSTVSWFPYLVVMVHVLWHVPKVFSRAIRVTVCSCRICACWAVVMQVIRGKSLTMQCLCWALLG